MERDAASTRRPSLREKLVRIATRHESHGLEMLRMLGDDIEGLGADAAG